MLLPQFIQIQVDAPPLRGADLQHSEALAVIDAPDQLLAALSDHLGCLELPLIQDNVFEALSLIHI